MTEWKTYLGEKKNRINIAITLFLLSIILFILPKFLQFVEARPGAELSDPLLNLFSPVDLTWITFLLIYAGLITAIIYLANRPRLLVLALKVYTITVIFRIIAMYFLPLNPPGTMISLNDPFVQFFGSGEILTKDLFFSGHTSTMFILFLVVESTKLKYLFLAGTILVAFSVLAQHVHYTIDVFAAPFFTYAAYRFAGWIDRYNFPSL